MIINGHVQFDVFPDETALIIRSIRIEYFKRIWISLSGDLIVTDKSGVYAGAGASRIDERMCIYVSALRGNREEKLKLPSSTRTNK